MAVIAVCAGSASAATEFGDSCVANRSSSVSAPTTLFALTASGDPLPLTAPSSGVVTKWKLNLVSEAAGFQIPQTLKVLRPNGPKSVQVIGESAQSVTGGSNGFNTRIPVQAGDRLGLFASGGGEFGLLFCQEEGGPKSRIGAFEGSASVGSSAPYEEGEGEVRVPAVAVIEPDADGDGYGDETQDMCPQSAATQVACPTVVLSTSTAVKKGLANVLVTASSQAGVTVAGTIKLAKGKSVKLNGGTQIVVPGTISKFTLLFPKKLRSALKELPRKRSLSLTVTATAPNIVGSPTTKTLKLRLAGQAKPKVRSHKRT
ncbi:MAG TPA: hypothetical protein VGC63_13930 [Solirubrobacterales bacterium]